ncbi:hypothetical protein [uncultured Enterovirga sp.]|uniref:hypothetical protein n=1 Tax=uncultured Enterovirga sp. TaxID=2026352 RepID=UPI0035CA0982
MPTTSPHSEWIAEALGTRNWVVAPSLTPRLRAKGYEVAISTKRLAEIKADYERATGEEARRIAADYERRFDASLASMLSEA